MLVSFATNERDAANAVATLEWMIQLDGKLDYDCVLTLGTGAAREEVTALAKKLFRSVQVLECDGPTTWPQGKNHAFQSLVRHLDAQGNKESFLWLEPDAIPLRKGWLAEIEREHIEGEKPFTGFVHDALNLMDCVGVYPPNFMEFSPHNAMLCRAAPWDRCAAAEIAPNVHRANHLLQFVNDIDGRPPSFKDAPALSLLRPGAVLFHKNKDGSLVQQLSKGAIKKFFGSLRTATFGDRKKEMVEKIVVVFAPCAKDIEQAITHAKWLQQLGRATGHRAVVAYDADCPAEKVSELAYVLTGAFESVSRFLYPTPPDKSYPSVANYAFARVAEYMAHGNAPWLWFESDAVVLKADWLETLQREYEAAGKAFMGPVVEGMGHVNGVAVYPPDAVVRIPKALTQNKVAWDFAARNEMNGCCHDAGKLMFHAWGEVNGRIHPTQGEAPDFSNLSIVRQIPSSAVLVHRCKTSALVDFLCRK